MKRFTKHLAKWLLIAIVAAIAGAAAAVYFAVTKFMEKKQLIDDDIKHIWRPFTQMKSLENELNKPIVIKKGRGIYLEDIDIAIEFQNNPEKTADTYYKKYVSISSKVKEIDKKNNRIILLLIV